MKRIRTLFLITAAAVLMTVFSVTAFAKDYKGDEVYQGLSGILPEDTLTLPKDTTDAKLIAKWGVRVIFRDDDETTIFKETVVPVTDEGGAFSDAYPDPSREGWIFKGWVRKDASPDASFVDGDKVRGITGPGPIIFQAEYEKKTDPAPTPTPDPTPAEPKKSHIPAYSGGGTSGSSGGATSVITEEYIPTGEVMSANFTPVSVLGANGRRLPQTGTTYVLAAFFAIIGAALLLAGHKKVMRK